MDQQTGSSLRNGFHGIEASLDLRESRCTRSQKCTNDRVVAISGVLLISDRGIPWRCEFDGVRRGENRPICVHKPGYGSMLLIPSSPRHVVGRE